MLLSLKTTPRGTFQMFWKQAFSIATSTTFLDSTRIYSVPSLSYKAYQIALALSDGSRS